MSGNKRTFERQKSGHLSEIENNPFERITCTCELVPLLLARIKTAHLLFKAAYSVTMNIFRKILFSF